MNNSVTIAILLNCLFCSDFVVIFRSAKENNAVSLVTIFVAKIRGSFI